MGPLPYFLVYVAPALLLAGALLGGWATLLPVLFVHVLLPVLDEAVGQDTAPGRAGARRWLWDLPLLLWVPTQLGLTAFVLQRLVTSPHTPAETLGLTLSLGVMNGSGGITVAHELMHRPGRLARALAELLMTSVSYPHFCVEHVHGHHRHVATPRDPATSRLGESVFAFLRRCLPGSLASAWSLEAERARRAGLGRFSLRDRRLRQPLLLGAAYTAVLVALGPRGALLFAAQGLVAVLLLEVINYLEHYGLARLELAPGQFERVRPEHSWNSSRRVGNWYLFNLARHSDHHWLASRPYEALEHHGDVPQLPAGYATMVLLALLPPLWFRVMDPRVRAWRERARAQEPSAA